MHVLPVDNLAALGPDEVLSVGGENAQGVLLARPGLPVDDVRALVHVDGALGQRAGLENTEMETGQGQIVLVTHYTPPQIIFFGGGRTK